MAGSRSAKSSAAAGLVLILSSLVGLNEQIAFATSLIAAIVTYFLTRP